MRKGQLRSSEALFRRAIMLTPGFGPFHWNLALNLSRQGRRREAGLEFIKADSKKL